MDRSEWLGKNTGGYDLSTEKGYPWGFADFERGSVGAALFDWAINAWNEMFPDEGLTMEELVLRDFEMYSNDMEFSVFLRDAWFRDYQELMKNQFNHFFWPQNERDVKAWLKKQLRLFLEENRERKAS
jgi:hypothetical protein